MRKKRTAGSEIRATSKIDENHEDNEDNEDNDRSKPKTTQRALCGSAEAAPRGRTNSAAYQVAAGRPAQLSAKAECAAITGRAAWRIN